MQIVTNMLCYYLIAIIYIIKLQFFLYIQIISFFVSNSIYMKKIRIVSYFRLVGLDYPRCVLRLDYRHYLVVRPLTVDWLVGL